VQAITAYLEHGRSVVLDELASLVEGRGELYRLMLDYPLRPAKALRPSLCIAACRALGGTEDAVRRTAAVLELYHNAFLIHDDIEDGSLYRRGGATLHRMHGLPIAINVADAMFALALEPLLENTREMGLAPALEILGCVARMTRVTVEGQALELRWIRSNTWNWGDDYAAAYAAMVVGKTAHYSFVTPLEVASIAARSPRDIRPSLESYGRHLGIAFQIVDDLLNLEGGSAYGKELRGDLWEGKRTLMLLHTLHHCAADARERATAILARPRPPAVEPPVVQAIEVLRAKGRLGADEARALLDAARPGGPYKSVEDIDWLFELIEHHGGMSFARSVAESHIAEARAAFEACVPRLAAGEHSDFLWGLIGYVSERSR